jgi:hypothetical protein
VRRRRNGENNYFAHPFSGMPQIWKALNVNIIATHSPARTPHTKPTPKISIGGPLSEVESLFSIRKAWRTCKRLAHPTCAKLSHELIASAESPRLSWEKAEG